MTFKEFLIKYDIPFKEGGPGVVFADEHYLIINHEYEFRKEMKNHELYEDRRKYHTSLAPKRSGDN